MTSVIKKNTNLIATEANEGRVNNQPAAVGEVKTFGGGRKGKRKRSQRSNNQSNRTSCSSVNGMKRRHQFEAKRRKLPSDNSAFKGQQNDGLKMVRLVPASGGMTGGRTQNREIYGNMKQ
uniref:Uncharacterized protein n=1 Tax=Globodera pallida TaxID=36090 RepID=A0A183BNY6_GLOPA